MNTTNYIRIFRGDDSDALGYQTIVGTINTDIDLAGCKAVFRFLGFYAEFDPIPEDKKLTIVIPAQASRGFPPGVGYASLKVIDAYGKIRTFTNRIPVIVDTMTPSCGCGEFEVSFSPFPELEPLKIFTGPNADDFDQYTGFVSKIIDRASLVKYGLVVLADAMSEDGGASGKAASPLAVKAAYDAIIKELVDNYYTAEQTEEAIDRVAAYYITYTAAGAAFPTYASLANAQTVYSGGSVRVPTRNDYCVVLADETHDNAEYRYIYSVAEGQTTGSWQPQFPVEGVMTVDPTVTKNSQNPVASSGIWSAIWGALAALPTGFSSLYDWCVAQLAGKASTADATLTPIYSDTPTFSEWMFSDVSDGITDIQQPVFIPPTDGEPRWKVKFGYDGRTLTTETFVTDEDATNLVFGYEDDGLNLHLTATRTRTDIIGYQLGSQTDKPLASEAEAEALRQGKLDNSQTTSDGLVTLSFISVNDEPRLRMTGAAGEYIDITFSALRVQIPGYQEFDLTLPMASGALALTAGTGHAGNLAALDAQGNPVDSQIPATNFANYLPLSGGAMTGNLYINRDSDGQNALWLWGGAWVGFVRTGTYVFCLQDARNKLANLNDIVDAANGDSTKYAKPASNPTAGNLAALDAQGNPTDSGVKASDKLDSTSAAPAFSSDSSTQYPVDSHCTYQGKLYKCTTATTGGTWVAASWTADTMTDPDAVLDVTSQNQLRVVAKDGTVLWAQGYDLASTSSATLACDATNNFTFADGATTQAFTLPTAPTGKVGDFGLDIDNSANTGAATMTLTGLDTSFSVVVPEGESLTDMLAIAAGELARFYITLSTFRVNNLPTWHIVKQVVENGGAQS